MSVSLRIDGLEIALADRERRFVLEVPTLHLDAGEAVGLTGPSGTGKTLLLELLGLLRRPQVYTSFEIVSDDGNVDLAAVWAGGKVSPPDVRAHMFGFVPQSGGLLPFLSVAQNIALSQRIAGKENADWQDQLITQLGLSEVRALHPAALSIGQRQRVAIARALAHRPAFVIADEPTAALDPGAARIAMGLLIDMAASGGAGVIISSHDLALLDQFPLRRVALELVESAGAETRSRLGPWEAAA